MRTLARRYWAALAIGWLMLASLAQADVYLNHPRGSNNKLSEQKNNVDNDNRLFDSQNNAAGGYQIGDACRPVCQDENQNYDENVEGAMQGTMKFYQGSELYIEWYQQHGCGVGHPNLRCQLILQYMSSADNNGLRDGTKRGNNNNAGGQQEPPTPDDAADLTLGQHESLDFYLNCKARERNKGLYTADQNVRNDRGATSTRQNPNGNANANQRHGLECPEERDYYPYWHPSPWHDIAIFTDDPVERCEFYRTESQNVMEKGECTNPVFNNPKACEQGGGSWRTVAPFDEPPPECVGGIQSRDNHNGNVRNGQPAYYVWRIPEYISGRVVLRLRYNITTTDFEEGSTITQDGPASSEKAIPDQFFIDEAFNDKNPGARRRAIFSGGPPILADDPKADFIGLGDNRVLQLQFNTDQAARTFQDRTHTFIVEPRPSDTSESARIVNYNVRGRRGNIVQVYPSVEYDFVPPELTVESGTYLHIQWIGSDANAKGNDGNGRTGTDRSNLVQVAARGENVPLPIDQHTLFFDAEDDPESPAAIEGRHMVDRFAYLDQDAIVTCDVDDNNENSVNNCKQLNGASAYFNGGLVKMAQVGKHHVASTRNNDFSNRSQKATITVIKSRWAWYSILSLALGCLVALSIITYFGAALYAYHKPTSWLFSKRYRPRVLNYLVSEATLQEKMQLRSTYVREKRKQWEVLVTGASEAKEPTIGKAAGPADEKTAASSKEAAEIAKPWDNKSMIDKCLRRCRWCGMREQRLGMLLYLLLNLIVFLIGFLSNLEDGFNKSLAYPFAKGGGYTLDLNFAVVVLPTLKSLQTAMRGAGATREWMPMDDPIYFHVAVGCLIMLGSLVHVVSHIVHMQSISSSPRLQDDPLELWKLTPSEKFSGTSVWSQLWDMHYRCAPVTGIVLTVWMALMFLTALPCARRGTNACTRRLGGYNLFWRVHMSWKWSFLILLLHAPTRLWIWLFFPAILIAVDRIMLAARHRPYVVLREAKLLPRDVIRLTFDVPTGFTYEAGQYILLEWRGEWHPFTLTSAPEEQRLTLHIRASDTLDWCSALRRRLCVEAPSVACAAAGIEFDANRAKAGIHYVMRACSRNNVVYCQPLMGSGDPQPAAKASTGVAPPASASTASSEQQTSKPGDLERGQSFDTFDSCGQKEELPADAVVLRISGPFGAPAQKVWHFRTIMAVGSGIGVTPFASILKSVQFRAKQREIILAAASSSTASKRPPRRQQVDKGMSQSANDTLEPLLRDVVTVPKQIYFYWIVRSQEELDWFYSLLEAAIEGPAKDNVHISVFMTGEIELSQVRKLTCTHQQYFGRPNWGRIFKQNREKHKGEHIGVFLCGSPAIGKELSDQSFKHTDPPGVEDGTRFSFFKEHF